MVFYCLMALLKTKKCRTWKVPSSNKKSLLCPCLIVRSIVFNVTFMSAFGRGAGRETMGTGAGREHEVVVWGGRMGK